MQDETSQPDGLHGNAAYAALLSEIRNGALSPGDRLRETDLAARLGISRTPVREAIRQLEADGLVTHVPRQGASVRSLNYAEVMELYEMRAVLEGTAARLAVRSASDVEIAELRALNEEIRAAGEGTRAFHLNRSFHALLLNSAKNRFLAKSVQAMQKAMMILGPTTLSQSERFENAVKEHGDVLDALEARDADAAEAAMRRHIEASQRTRIKAFRETDALPT
ncbi:GntR family transcriptional regulator [Shimia isoporae]|uniref:GntR family transcriptional regulator n=1 Tax=Shimia isoporae TaxID=647720 RepID=A0A4R1NAZ7_9RHOB|nr:GntR family transcriptional regulator [Shimia isoporae]TCL00596.1 GntR family transcriptional regulator [Shimia isoporae]